MSERASRDAAVEAQRDITTHPDRPLPHVDKISHFLAGLAYSVAHPHRSESDQGDPTDDTR